VKSKLFGKSLRFFGEEKHLCWSKYQSALIQSLAQFILVDGINTQWDPTRKSLNPAPLGIRGSKSKSTSFFSVEEERLTSQGMELDIGMGKMMISGTWGYPWIPYFQTNPSTNTNCCDQQTSNQYFNTCVTIQDQNAINISWLWSDPTQYLPVSQSSRVDDKARASYNPPTGVLGLWVLLISFWSEATEREHHRLRGFSTLGTSKSHCWPRGYFCVYSNP